MIYPFNTCGLQLLKLLVQLILVFKNFNIFHTVQGTINEKRNRPLIEVYCLRKKCGRITVRLL